MSNEDVVLTKEELKEINQQIWLRNVVREVKELRKTDKIFRAALRIIAREKCDAQHVAFEAIKNAKLFARSSSDEG